MANKKQHKTEEQQRMEFYSKLKTAYGEKWCTAKDFCKVFMWWDGWLEEGIHYTSEVRIERRKLTPDEVIHYMYYGGGKGDGHYPFITFEYTEGDYYIVIKNKYFQLK